MWYLWAWVFLLHLIGAITFYNFIDSVGSKELKESLNEMQSRYVMVVLLMLWPYIMLCWLATGKNN